MTDLHTRLHAAITTRMETARADLSGDWLETVIRMCQRDLKVLERHAATSCDHCDTCNTSEVGVYGHDLAFSVRYPCPEIRDMAEAYGVSG